MTQHTNHEAPPDLLTQLRKLTPKRALTYGDALMVAKLQALQARNLLGLTAPRADLTWLLHFSPRRGQGAARP